MPNWCKNTLNVIGPQEDVQAFMRQAQSDTPLSFNRFVPMPEELAVPAPPFFAGDLAEPPSFNAGDLDLGMKDPDDDLNAVHEANTLKYGSPHWYDWRRKHWGTSWEAADVWEPEFSVLEDDDLGRACAQYRFRSAWNPPMYVLEAMTLRFPGLVFLLWWDDPQADRAGYMLAANGQVIDRRSGVSDIRAHADRPVMAEPCPF